MTVFEFATKHGFTFYGDGNVKQVELKGLYATDLLSWVMGHSLANQGWITVQTHVNVVAVAVLRELSCIIIAENASIPEETLQRAKEEQIAIIHTTLPVYEICSLYAKDDA